MMTKPPDMYEEEPLGSCHSCLAQSLVVLEGCRNRRSRWRSSNLCEKAGVVGKAFFFKKKKKKKKPHGKSDKSVGTGGWELTSSVGGQSEGEVMCPRGLCIVRT